MPIYALGEMRPTLPAEDEYWIAPGAQVIGDCTLAPGASVWFNAVIRADNEPTRIGRNTNIQDNAVLHNDPGFPLTIGDDVTVGHLAIVHGCTVGDGSLIGMGAKILNGAVIGRNCLVGAGALVAEGKEIPDNSLVVGAPGKVVRTLDDATVEMVRRASVVYHKRWQHYRTALSEIATG